jgi:hypothetical protein
LDAVPKIAVRVTVAVAVTSLDAEALKVTESDPVAMVTVAGTLSVAESLEEISMVRSLCAGTVSLTWQVVLCPGVTVEGVQLNEVSDTTTYVLVASGMCVGPVPGGPVTVDGLELCDGVAVAVAEVDAVADAWGITDGTGRATSMPTGLPTLSTSRFNTISTAVVATMDRTPAANVIPTLSRNVCKGSSPASPLS